MTIFDGIYDAGYDYLGYLFGEKIYYHAVGKNPRLVNAMIDRNKMALGDDGIPVTLHVITVKNTSSGILSDTVNKAGDFFMIEKRRGEEPRRVSVLDVEDSVSGVTVMSCR